MGRSCQTSFEDALSRCRCPCLLPSTKAFHGRAPRAVPVTRARQPFVPILLLILSSLSRAKGWPRWKPPLVERGVGWGAVGWQEIAVGREKWRGLGDIGVCDCGGGLRLIPQFMAVLFNKTIQGGEAQWSKALNFPLPPPLQSFRVCVCMMGSLI